ncbi:hypothetical protein SAMN04487912_104328 [Arthrobacter sp. cf158]|uniref:hypothetical protein n=1 Tax=Arthrobacter sp. cf158 TaxID=1761744 RepID=UPI0008954A31|nr:hypothetical protein [Arthrobacter sp. cf158]SDW75461.1 hypothetical protein SAMN04487912_104328 [Arthrobacter sp. cf158]
MVPAFLSELRRPWLWKGWALGIILVLGFIALLLLAACLEDGVSLAGLQGPLLEAALTLTLTGSAVVGSFAFTADYRTGGFRRRVLLFQRCPAFLARAIATTLTGFLSGLFMGLIFGLAVQVLDEEWHVRPPTILAFAGLAWMGAGWGFLSGSLIRNHLVSLFAVPLSLLLPGMLMGPQLQYFPVLASDWANQTAVNIPALGSFMGAVGWLLVITAVAFGAFLKRDLA